MDALNFRLRNDVDPEGSKYASYHRGFAVVVANGEGTSANGDEDEAA